METLPNIPMAYEPQITSEFAADVVRFGDGYVQRRPSGINSVTETWSVEWLNLGRADYEVVYQFLQVRKSVEPFLWQPPWEDAPRVWVCESLSSTRPTAPNTGSIQASFVEEHR